MSTVTLTLRTMNPGKADEFTRVFLGCPGGHETGASSPIESASARRWLSGDLTDESCGRVGQCAHAYPTPLSDFPVEIVDGDQPIWTAAPGESLPATAGNNRRVHLVRQTFHSHSVTACGTSVPRRPQTSQETLPKCRRCFESDA